jgi:hypothetical protein
MADEWYSPDRKPRVVGELLFEIRDDHVVWRYECFDVGESGFDLRVFRDDEFYTRRLFPNRDAVMEWAARYAPKSGKAVRDE